MLGNVDDDAVVTVFDALRVLRHAVGLESVDNVLAADVDGDGVVTVFDALRILRFAVEGVPFN